MKISKIGLSTRLILCIMFYIMPFFNLYAIDALDYDDYEQVVIDQFVFAIERPSDHNEASAVLVSYNDDPSITEITVPDTIIVDGLSFPVKHALTFAFDHTSYLKTIVFQNSIEYIGGNDLIISYWTIKGDNSVTSIHLPNSLKCCGNIFDAYPNLKEIYIDALPLQLLSAGFALFTDNDKYSDITLYVPKGGLVIAQNLPPWNRFTNIKEIGNNDDTTPIDEIWDNELCYNIHRNNSNQDSYAEIVSCNQTLDSAHDGVLIPDNITVDGIRIQVTSIGDGAFIGSDIKSISIPNSVTSIGNYAFTNCENLKHIDIPSSVKSIGIGAFFHSGLTDVSFPQSGHISIGNFAFAACDKLTSFNATPSITEIGEHAFNGCISMSSVKLSNSIDRIKIGTFFGCVSLRSIDIPSSINAIENSAFVGCPLMSITLPDGLIQIGKYAFCASALSSITIPNSVVNIGKGAFGNCNRLSTVKLSESLSIIGSESFKDCYNLSELSLPNSIISIGKSAFSGCTSLNSISIPESIDKLEPYIFGFCENLSSITIPNTVKSIGDHAFDGCMNLKSLPIPSSVEYIGYGVSSPERS